MSKRILVIGINCLPELTGIGKYTGEMVKWFAENGHETTVVTGFPYYPNWEVQRPYNGNFYKKESMSNGKLTLYRCPLYIPKKPSGLKRLLHEATFFATAFFVVFRLLFKKKHEIIFAISPPFHLGFLGLFYRFFKGGKIVYHIQDLQIDAAKELNMLPDGLFSMLFSLERFLLRKTDYLSTISAGMTRKILGKVQRDVLFFPNWVDISKFYPIQNRNELKQEWGYKSDDFIVLYSGSIGEKQGLDSLIDIAINLKELRNFQFLICGTGPYKEILIKLAENNNLTNVRFLPLQEYEVFNKFLNMADIHLVLQKANASDLVMPSKLSTILAVGGAVLVTANADTTLYEVINENHLGIVSPAEDEISLIQKLRYAHDNDLEPMRINARLYAEKFLDKNNILPEILTKF